jgi:LiaF transmembrane domain
MTDQIPNPDPNASPEPPNSGQNPTPPPYQDWREQRHAERMKRREERWQMRNERWQRRSGRPYGWLIGALLVVIGIIFLLETLGIRTFANWWALLILIPAFWAYVAAWNIYQFNHRISSGVVASFVIAVALTLLTGVLLFNFTLGVFWPILLIVAGLVVVITALFPR